MGCAHVCECTVESRYWSLCVPHCPFSPIFMPPSSTSPWAACHRQCILRPHNNQLWSHQWHGYTSLWVTVLELSANSLQEEEFCLHRFFLNITNYLSIFSTLCLTSLFLTFKQDDLTYCLWGEEGSLKERLNWPRWWTKAASWMAQTWPGALEHAALFQNIVLLSLFIWIYKCIILQL